MLIKSAKKKALKVEAIQSITQSPIQLVFHFNSKVKTAIGSQVQKEAAPATPQGTSEKQANKAATAIKLCVNQRSQLIGIRASVLESNRVAQRAIELKSDDQRSKHIPSVGRSAGASLRSLKLSVLCSTAETPSAESASSLKGSSLKGSTAVLWLEPPINKETSAMVPAWRGNTQSASELFVYQLWCSLMIHSGCLSVSGVNIVSDGGLGLSGEPSELAYNTNQSMMLLGGKIYGKEYSAYEILKILTNYGLSCSVDSVNSSLFGSRETASVTGVVGVSGGATTQSYGLDKAGILTPESLELEYAQTVQKDGCPAVYAAVYSNLSNTLSLADRVEGLMRQSMSILICLLLQVGRES
jgi:hypothetical protein